MTPARLHITPSLLAKAWAGTNRGPEWPPTFGEALAHPLYSRLLRATACGLAQREQQQREALARQHAQQLPDIKRIAAGDRDD